MKQGEFQSVEDYIAEMRKLAQKINADEKLICYAVLNSPKIVRFHMLRSKIRKQYIICWLRRVWPK